MASIISFYLIIITYFAICLLLDDYFQKHTKEITTFFLAWCVRFVITCKKRRGGFSAKVIHTHTKVPLKYYEIIYFHSNLPLFMLKRVFGQNNEKIILLFEKINFSCTYMLCRSKYMLRKEWTWTWVMPNCSIQLYWIWHAKYCVNT